MLRLWYVQGAVGQKLRVLALCQPDSILQPPDGDRGLPVGLAVQDSRVLRKHGDVRGLRDEGQLAETQDTWRGEETAQQHQQLSNFMSREGINTADEIWWQNNRLKLELLGPE